MPKLFTVPASVTSLLYSYRFDSIQISNALIHVLCLPPPFGLFLFFKDVFNYGLWQCLGELSDPSLRSLASKIESTVIASRPPGTNEAQAYRRAFLRWKEFASSKTEICAFPPDSEHVALHLQHLPDTTHSHSAVDSATCGIQWAHRYHLAGLPSFTTTQLAERLRE